VRRGGLARRLLAWAAGFMPRTAHGNVLEIRIWRLFSKRWVLFIL
jgi:hypothetical protein